MKGDGTGFSAIVNISNGDFWIFFQRPASLSFLALALASILATLFGMKKKFGTDGKE
jgi:TctA family transporter